MDIKNILKLYSEFKEFLLIRRLCRTVELSETHKSIIRSYNKDYEKEMNALILHKVSEEMLDWNLTPDKYLWIKLALGWRISMMGQLNHKFPITTNKE